MNPFDGIARLEQKLLGFGGQILFRPEGFVDPDLDLLLSHGQVWKRWRVRLIAGVPHRCHANAAVNYLGDRHFGTGRMQIVTGYALAGEMWHQHSWLWEGRRIWETTDRRDLYFGVILEGDRLTRFIFGGLVENRLVPWPPNVAPEAPNSP